ncbi:MAG: hypothetical protein OEY20_04305 [Gemmatimonadota bacterium]|nr:hypothetical protein [Gemmatimonadota bacterium]MDH5196450.1 hypothetical protein [Gemmatimonadota bacterium]
MARRTIEVEGERWQVFPSGRMTSYQRDEFGLVFLQGTGVDRIRRFVRYAPQGAPRWDASLGELTDAQLQQLFAHSQTEWTSPVARMSAHRAERGGR